MPEPRQLTLTDIRKIKIVDNTISGFLKLKELSQQIKDNIMKTKLSLIIKSWPTQHSINRSWASLATRTSGGNISLIIFVIVAAKKSEDSVSNTQ